MANNFKKADFMNNNYTSWAALESNSLWSWMADYPWGGG